jgi:hypothetical protein
MTQAIESRLFDVGTRGEISDTEGFRHALSLSDVSFTRDAMYTLGLAIKEIANYIGVFPNEISSRLDGDLYWTEGIDTLTIVFQVPEIEAEMIIQIPKEHWGFREAPDTSH